jgi:hypothetical protein
LQGCTVFDEAKLTERVFHLDESRVCQGLQDRADSVVLTSLFDTAWYKMRFKSLSLIFIVGLVSHELSRLDLQLIDLSVEN